MKHKPKYSSTFYKLPLCDGKNRYPTKSQAESVKAEQELLSPGLVLMVYRCQTGCHDWHLTRRRQPS